MAGWGHGAKDIPFALVRGSERRPLEGAVLLVDGSQLCQLEVCSVPYSANRRDRNSIIIYMRYTFRSAQPQASHLTDLAACPSAALMDGRQHKTQH